MDRKRKASLKGTWPSNLPAQHNYVRVDDDFPEIIPITADELDAIESFLQSLLEELL